MRDGVLLVLLAWVEEFDLILGYGDFAQLWVDLEGFGVALLGLDVHWILCLILDRGLVGEFTSFVVHHFFLEAEGRLPVLGAAVAAVVGELAVVTILSDLSIAVDVAEVLLTWRTIIRCSAHTWLRLACEISLLSQINARSQLRIHQSFPQPRALPRMLSLTAQAVVLPTRPLLSECVFVCNSILCIHLVPFFCVVEFGGLYDLVAWLYLVEELRGVGTWRAECAGPLVGCKGHRLEVIWDSLITLSSELPCR